MDEKLTQDIQKWLDTPSDARSVEEGAVLLLKMNRNRILFHNIISRPDKMMGKLEYELRKHLRIRLDGKTLRDVVNMTPKVMESARLTLAEGQPVPAGNDTATDTASEHPDTATDGQASPAFIGKRADHDQLPDHIKELYDRNGIVYQKMKQEYNNLLAMENAEPCDRYEHLKILQSLDTEYRQNWDKYDNWQAPADGTDGDDKPAAADPAEVAKKVSAARKYLSENKKKLPTLDEVQRDALLAKMQDRVDFLLSTGNGFDGDYRQELEALGLRITTDTPQEEQPS